MPANKSKYIKLSTARAIIRHTTTPHDIILFRQDRKGRIQITPQGIRSRPLHQRFRQVANAFRRHIGQGIAHGPAPLPRHNVPTPNETILLLPVQANGSNLIRIHMPSVTIE
jgi:hypothetical protein